MQKRPLQEKLGFSLGNKTRLALVHAYGDKKGI